MEMRKEQWFIYNFIKERSKQELWSNQIDIQNHLKEKYDIDISQRTIRRCINLIRKNDLIQKIILTDYKKGYRIMSSTEEDIYLEKRKISILKMLSQYHKDFNRLKLNNQTRIKFSEKERDFIESILKIEKG